MVAREEVKFASLFWDTNLTNWSLQRELRVKHQLVKKKKEQRLASRDDGLDCTKWSVEKKHAD